MTTEELAVAAHTQARVLASGLRSLLLTLFVSLIAFAGTVGLWLGWQGREFAAETRDIQTCRAHQQEIERASSIALANVLEELLVPDASVEDAAVEIEAFAAANDAVEQLERC